MTAADPDAPGDAAPEQAAARERLDRLAHLLDSRFRIPGTQIRFGVDPILGVLPGVGDVAALLPAVAVILQAVDLGARGATLVRMIANTALDTVVGSVPVLGTVFDVVFKANERNIRLLHRHLDDPDQTRAASTVALVVGSVVIVLAVLAVVALVFWAIVALLVAVF